MLTGLTGRLRTSAEFWLNLQKLYELRQARREIGSGLEKLPRLAGRKPKSKHTPTVT